jgi:drug/metabolite transporter (DMT)-like permease
MSNVLVLKTSRVLPDMKPEMRTAVIFGGSALFSAVAAGFEPMAAPPAGEMLGHAVLLVLALGFVLASNNMLVQYGLALVPANRASIIMLFELVVTALTAWLFAGETPGPREWAGGGCIVLASLLSSWLHRSGAAGTAASGKDDADDSDADGGSPAERQNGARAMV